MGIARFSSVAFFAAAAFSDVDENTENGTLVFATDAPDDIVIDVAGVTAQVPLEPLRIHGATALAAYDATKAYADWAAAKALFDEQEAQQAQHDEFPSIPAPTTNYTDPGPAPVNPLGGARAWDLGSQPDGSEPQIVIAEDDPMPLVVGGIAMSRELYTGLLAGADLLAGQ